MNLITNSDMATLLPHPQHIECMHAYIAKACCVGKKLTKMEVANQLLPAAAQAPAWGRLAAAMATIWASFRPIRDGAVRSNARTCAISFSSGAGQRPGAPWKMVFGG
jgi:hypothetical protein